MPLPNYLHLMIKMTVFSQTIGIDAVAYKQVTDFMEYTGLDSAPVVMEMPPNELTSTKLKALIPADHALASISPGQLAKIAIFLRKWQDGTYDRFMIDHDPEKAEHLELLVNGSDVHSYLSEWTPLTFEEATILKLVIKDSNTFRLFQAYVKTRCSDIAYLLGDSPVDNYTKIGKKKDDNLLLLLTSVLSQSQLSFTFSLGTDARETGVSLFRRVKTYFLNAQDQQAEIQLHQAALATISFANHLSVQSLIESAQQTVASLKELGKDVEPVELYTSIRTALLKANDDHIKQCCVAFRAMNPVPNNLTLSQFLAYLTTDFEVMAFRNQNAKGINYVGGGEDTKKGVVLSDKQKTEKRLRRNVLKQNKKSLNAAMHSVNINDHFSHSADNWEGMPHAAIRFVKETRKEWNDDTYTFHQDINKTFNSFVDTKGRIDYRGFKAQMIRDYQQSKSATAAKAPLLLLESSANQYLDTAALSALTVDDGHRKLLIHNN
jgi:hypothetical protein